MMWYKKVETPFSRIEYIIKRISTKNQLEFPTKFQNEYIKKLWVTAIVLRICIFYNTKQQTVIDKLIDIYMNSL